VAETAHTIPSEDITALVLAGGQGSRMGGLDKGLQPFRGQALAQHAAQRLWSSRSVGALALSANRNPQAYAAFGWPVVSDLLEGFQGPLAGFMAGWSVCRTPYLLTIPCDTPLFPHDLVAHLAATLLAQQARIAIACAPESPSQPELRRQPAFCLMHRSVADDLQHFVQGGGRKIGAWAQRHPLALVPFNRAQDSPWAFTNVNTLDDLHALECRTELP
jgi:molybdopterin-guanine dinucleotide biosynthesis protein A